MLASKAATVSDDGDSSGKSLKRRVISCFAPLFLFIVLQTLPWFWGGLKQSVFCFPASALSAALLGAELGRDAEGYPVLALSSVALRVGESCSGYDFFCLGAGILFWILRREKSGTTPELLLSAVLIAVSVSLLATQLANVSRLCCVAWLSPPASALVPAPWHGLFHYSLGVLVFLPYLLALTLASERMLHVFRHTSR